MDADPLDPTRFEGVAVDVLENLHEGCQVIGFDGRYRYVNEAVVRQSRRSREELLGARMVDCFPGIEATPMYERLVRCLQDRTPDSMENEFPYPDGSVGWFELRFLPVQEGACILSLEVTGRKRDAAAMARAESQLRQAQKMEAIGRLAGGIAHDFNNILSVILGHTDLVTEALAKDDPTRLDLEEVRKAARRAESLTRQLLAFSRRQILDPKVVDLNTIVQDLVPMLRRLIGENRTLVTNLTEDLGRVRVDPTHVEQVILNLVINARDATPRGGTITIETENQELDAAYAEAHLDVRPGPHVALTVRDDGIGMPEEVRARIFEPFFSTKAVGEGTGLGLSTVFGIVRQSEGTIWVYSQPDQGSVFRVYLPRTDDPLAEASPAIVQVELSGAETILLVEDEDPLRQVARRLLTRAGYRVVEARDGVEALEVAAGFAGELHLLLTDVVMPRMGGGELADQMQALRPGIRVLFLSGYPDDVLVHERILTPGSAVLQKPVSKGALLAKVRTVLDTVREPPRAAIEP